MSKRSKAAVLNGKALDLQRQGQMDEAIALYQEACALDPRWSTPFYNLGLLHKFQRNWQESYKNNQRATELDASNEAAWWNLGIAATALGRWQSARLAWRGFGIKVPDGDGPLDLPCGIGPIRLDPKGHAEVVWAHRLDPARAKVASIPFPESGHRWSDVVLNDGAPNGFRKHQGKDVPVLDAIELLQPSVFGTFVARVRFSGQSEDVARLTEIADEREGCAEDWSTSTRIICKACSEGRPHTEHDADKAPPDDVHLIGIAARDSDHAESMLAAWQLAVDGIVVESLDEALEAGPQE